ncbi:MAG TPA: methyltransferase domain-containing protein [Thermoanaerobaculia bacterium]
MTDVTRAGAFWDEQSRAASLKLWMAHEPARRYINKLISGNADRWPLDWFQETFNGLQFDRALSVGCGAGALERDLVRRKICATVDAFDGSVASLAIARKLALTDGSIRSVRYYAADFNAPILRRKTYDAVFCHQSLHHVAKLEKLFRAILYALRDDGYLFIDEYIGPSRFEWTPALLAAAAKVYQTVVPPNARLFEELPPPIVPGDPSEAFRSSEILPQLKRGFEIVAMRPYGGNLLAVICPQVDWTQAPPDLMDTLISIEQERFPMHETSYHAVIVARPKKRVRAYIGASRYFIEPKLKRIGREVAHLARRGRPRASQ